MNTLVELLARPEGRTLEFKRQEVPLDKALKTLVAFANTAGGTLVLGVDDDGTPLGVDDIKAQEERFASTIVNGIEPPLTPDLKPIRIDGADLLLIRVPRFPGPFYLRAQGPDEGVYVRLGSTNRRATESQREEMRRLASAHAYDERPCLGATLDDIDIGTVERVFREVDREIGNSDLETLGILVRHGDERVPSNGGIILFGTAEARNRFFPAARVRCARFVGTDKAQILDRLDVEGTVLDGLDEVPRFIRRNTRMAARIETVRRQDLPEYSATALREVLANAVAHADYSQRGMPLRVQIYDDRMEVENPGGWPIGFSEEDFKEGISRIRNPVIARTLHELGIIEGWGSGYERISAECGKDGYPLPEWREAGPVLRVRFTPHPDVAREPMRLVVPRPVGENGGDVGENSRADGARGRNASDDVGENVGEKFDDDVGGISDLTERQRWFLERVGRGAYVRPHDVADHFGVAVRTAERDIAALRDAELVAFIGATKTGRYVLLEHRRVRTDADPETPA
jgi:ATP-dependent DNA helicase RecG